MNHNHTTACSECQAGRCCGHCWCCYDKDRHTRPLPPTEEAATRKALTLAMGDVGRVDGLDWLSSRGRDKVDLQEVCG